MDLMPISKVCPLCGRRAHDALLVQCPDCRVPFVLSEAEGAGTGKLSPEQMRLLVNQVFSSWKFWTVLVILIGASAWAVAKVADKIIEERSKKMVNAIESHDSNQMGFALGQISNQINSAFRQPHLQSAIETAAMAHAADLFTNGVKPTLEEFLDEVDQAKVQLAKKLADATNLIAQIQSNALAAQKQIPPPVTNPVATTIAPPVTEQRPPPEPVDVVKLSLINRSIIQAGSNYLLTLFFKSTGTPATGPVDIAVATYKQTARILSLAPMTALAILPPTINGAGDIAQLHFTVTDHEAPTLVLEVSAPTIVRFVSDSLDGNITIPIASEKMLISGPTN